MTTSFSILPPVAIFIALHAAILKLAARILRYTVTWKRSFPFAVAMLIVAIVSRMIQFALGYWLPIALAVILGFAAYLLVAAWLFGQHATDASAQLLGWRGRVRLSICAFVLTALFAVVLLGASALLHAFHPVTRP